MKYTSGLHNDLRASAHFSKEVGLTSAELHALLDEIERLQSAEIWIPVSERLPEDDGRYSVLVEVLGTLLLAVATYYSAQKCFRYIPYGDIAEVSYWTVTPELPQPPSESQVGGFVPEGSPMNNWEG